MDDDDILKLRYKLSLIFPSMNEKQKRFVAAVEAQNIGWGGISIIAQITGLSTTTIRKGIQEIKYGNKNLNQIRKKGGGRKKLSNIHPNLKSKIENLIDEHTLGDPENPLRWTCKSVRNIADALNKSGSIISYVTISRLLHEMNFSLKGNRKVKEGTNHPDRNKQFKYINSKTKRTLKEGNPVISVDAKKKELIGNYKNPGREWSGKGKKVEVNSHDFPDPKVAKATPFGIYDIGDNKGWVNVGISANTAEFAVESIRGWWQKTGKERYNKSKKLTICADAGGSNGYRLRLWKMELQKLSNDNNLIITVHHFPPGTSKWNKIEHRLFSFISINWRGKPLRTYQIIIDLIASTKTKTGLTVKAVLDQRTYKRGIKISDEKMSLLNIKKHAFHGEWNYTISPKK